MFCCQLINNGNATSAEIARALNVNREKLSRWARLDRVSNSIKPDIKKRLKRGNVLTEDKISEIETLHWNCLMAK